MTNARNARSAREKAAEMRAEAARKDARRMQFIVAGSVVAVIAIIVAIFVVVRNAQHNKEVANARIPANVTAQNGVVVGNSNAPVTIVAYEDFQCPVCREFEQIEGAQVDKWVAEGKVKVEYRPIAILDERGSTNKYPSRALNLVAAVVNTHPNLFTKVHAALFASQPEEGTAGPSNDQLIATAVGVGVPKADIESAVKNGDFAGWVKRATDDSGKKGVKGTPTIFVNDQEVKIIKNQQGQQMFLWADTNAFKQLIDAAAAKAGATPTASGTVSPSASASTSSTPSPSASASK